MTALAGEAVGNRNENEHAMAAGSIICMGLVTELRLADASTGRTHAAVAIEFIIWMQTTTPKTMTKCRASGGILGITWPTAVPRATSSPDWVKPLDMEKPPPMSSSTPHGNFSWATRQVSNDSPRRTWEGKMKRSMAQRHAVVALPLSGSPIGFVTTRLMSGWTHSRTISSNWMAPTSISSMENLPISLSKFCRSPSKTSWLSGRVTPRA
mmetsp:Transcript_57739/g.175888  ORF Transcript_57739/g.175888 Transcript_57739/m.175888 type:complete len:210 (+) Transcript_57739:427-1056(+)